MVLSSFRGEGILTFIFNLGEYLVEGKWVEVCLNHDAKPLGLYDREIRWYEPECTVI
jgi:hypothetical protein